MSESRPETEAGREFLRVHMGGGDPAGQDARAILAIEAEAAQRALADVRRAVDVDRLTRAFIALATRAGWSVYRTGDGSASWVDRREVARLLAVEYEADYPRPDEDGAL